MILRPLRWLIAIRLLLLASLTVLYLLLRLLPAEATGPGSGTGLLAGFDPQFPSLLVGAGYLLSLVWIALLRFGERFAAVLAHGQFLGDLLLITGFVYFFGGIASPFSILYLVVIAVAAAMLRRRTGLVVAAEAYVIYSLLLVGLYAGWLPSPTSPFAEPVSLWRLEYNLVTHLLGFFGVAQLVSSLAQTAARAELELEERRDEIADLEVAQRDVIQSIPSGLIATDPGGVVISVNRVGERILGVSERSLRGRPVAATGLFDEEDWAGLAAEGKGRREVALTIGGEERHIGFTVTSLSDSHGAQQGFILVYQDLTDWRRLEEELRLKDRMAAVGEMAAGLAHEIGNPLAAISGSVQMLQRADRDEEQQAKLLGIILRESQRLDRTVKDFLRFARPRPPRPVRFDVARLLADDVALLRNSRDLGDHHEVELVLDPATASIVADPDQVSQIFWNLVRNALKAMPSGGRVTVRGMLVDDLYELEVEDTGRGMGEEEQRRLFQPFTSFFDQGAGVGMAIVYRIVQEHSGRLGVVSAPGVGTTIRVTLPTDGAQSKPQETVA